MRRPITATFISFAGGVFLGHYLIIQAWLPVLSILTLIAINLKRGADKSLKVNIVSLLLIIVVGAGYLTFIDGKIESLNSYSGKTVNFNASVIYVDEMEGYLRLVVKLPRQKENGFEGGQKLIVNLSHKKGMRDKELEEKKLELLGKKIQVEGKLVLPKARTNPGLFDYKLYLKTKGVSAVVNVSDSNLIVIKGGHPLAAATERFKQGFLARITPCMGDAERALFSGILFGDKTLINEDLYESFQRNGCAHILSVSGLHIGIVFAGLGRLFRNKRSRIGSVCVLSALLLYGALASFSPSVVRAVTMIGVYIFSKLLHRKYDLLCSAAFSGILMLIYNPFNLFNVGFQLSYLAILSLAFAHPIACKAIDYFERYNCFRYISFPINIFSFLLIIQLCMAPAIAYHFMYFSLSAFLINLPVMYIASIVLPMGICLMALSVFLAETFLWELLISCVDIMVGAMININELAGNISFSSMNVKAPTIFSIAVFYGLFFFFSSECFMILLKRQEKKKILVVLCCIVFLSGLILNIAGEDFAKNDVVFLDVGQGDCIHFKTPSGKNVLIDGGGSVNFDTGKKILLPYFLKNRINKIDLALVTHLHLDHYGGIASLCKLMPVEKMVVYEGNVVKKDELLADTGLEIESFIFAASGDSIYIDEDMSIKILYPNRYDKKTYNIIMADEEDENLSCLVAKAVFKNISVLITGDVGFEGEELLLKDNDEKTILRSDVLKVGHHGSKYSTSMTFLDAIDPTIAVIQVGNNNYGHPHPDTIEKLSKKSIMVFRNDEEGAVILRIKPENISIRTML